MVLVALRRGHGRCRRHSFVDRGQVMARSELHLYVRGADRERIDSLPPDVSLSEIFRRGLEAFELARATCTHPVAQCVTCHDLVSSHHGHPVATLTDVANVANVPLPWHESATSPASAATNGQRGPIPASSSAAQPALEGDVPQL